MCMCMYACVYAHVLYWYVHCACVGMKEQIAKRM